MTGSGGAGITMTGKTTGASFGVLFHYSIEDSARKFLLILKIFVSDTTAKNP
jgi:hypothetical protein